MYCAVNKRPSYTVYVLFDVGCNSLLAFKRLRICRRRGEEETCRLNLGRVLLVMLARPAYESSRERNDHHIKVVFSR
jgi:hypothetical protein